QGELISCDQNGSIKVWDLSANECTHEWVSIDGFDLIFITNPRYHSSLSLVRKLLCSRSSMRIHPKLWIVLAHVFQVPEEDVPIRSVTVASDGSMLVAANNKLHWDWDYDECVPLRHLATCSADTTVKIWSTSSFQFELEKTLVGHQRWVWDCAFSADSAYLVTASSDHVARLWELAQGETIRQYNGHNKAAVCVALNDLSIG
ncbi:quinon protein alcohol dehydrogenase-like superfamily, partial [Jimgerdemannia flammicorona]